MTSSQPNIRWESACLLLGAGFSVEMHMPMVWDLTRELKNWLTPQKLAELNSKQPRGEGLPQEVCQLYSELYKNKDLHYEQIIRLIQDARARSREPQNPYTALALKLTSTVNLILYLRHKRRAKLIAHSAQWYQGLKSIADIARPLWVFSLNHDVCTEIICDAHSIPWSNGIPEEKIDFLETNIQGSERITFNRIERKFFNETHAFGSIGVNLVKLHGALDLFVYRDRQDLLYVPRGDRIATLERIYERARYLDDEGNPIRLLDELAISDVEGELQFLQPTLLTGHKFTAEIDHHAPREFLDMFARKLEAFESAVVIGYSFGDAHIDQILLAWLRKHAARRIYVVNPCEIRPESMSSAMAQVKMIPKKAVDFLAAEGGTPLSNIEQFHRKFADFLRNPSRFSKESIEYIRRRMDPRDRLRKLALRLGGIKERGTGPGQQGERQ